jgi:hypothetical protein
MMFRKVSPSITWSRSQMTKQVAGESGVLATAAFGPSSTALQKT